LAALLEDIESWRHADRHLWERQTRGRDKALGRRDDAWARVAAWLAGTAAQIVLDDTVLTELSRAENTSVPKDVVAIAGRQRMDAAVGRLRERIRTTAQREGVPVIVVSHLGLSRTHAACGHVNPADGRYHRSTTTRCEGCSKRYDPDSNATALMLAAADRRLPHAAE
jgi:transposase